MASNVMGLAQLVSLPGSRMEANAGCASASSAEIRSSGKNVSKRFSSPMTSALAVGNLEAQSMPERACWRLRKARACNNTDKNVTSSNRDTVDSSVGKTT